MQTLITILARKNSKGLPGKNTKILHGKPLVQWTIDQAEAWGLNHGSANIIVSSDDEQVKKIALKHNLWFVHRPSEMATDLAGKVKAIRHAWQWAEHNNRQAYDCVIDLDVTNPMRRITDIEAVHKLMEPPTPFSVFSVTPARRNPYFNMYPCLPNLEMPLTRQIAPKMFDLNCCIYAYSREFMLSDRQHPITKQSIHYVMPDYSFCDIDTELDWQIVELLMAKYGENLEAPEDKARQAN